MSGETVGNSGNKRDRDRVSDDSPSPKNQAKRHTMGPETDSEKLDRILSQIGVLGTSLNTLNTRVAKIEESSSDMMRKWDERAAEWAVEREELVQRFKAMESRVNQLERRDRQNFAIVKGMPNINNENVLSEVNKVFGQLSVRVEVESATVIRPQTESQGALIKTRFKSWSDKIAVFKQKKSLVYGGANVFIDDDLTKREQEIRFHQRQLRRQERKKNPNVDFKIRGDQVCINGEWRAFDELSKNFVPKKN